MESEDEDEGDKTKNPKIYEPTSEEIKRIYKKTNRLVIEKFGKNSRAHKRSTSGIDIDKGLGSNPLWAFAIQNYLIENNESKRLITIDEFPEIYEQGYKPLNNTHTHTPEIILRGHENKYPGNQYVINYLEMQLENQNKEFEGPLRITNPGMIKDYNYENPYGALPTIEEYTKIEEDNRFSHEHYQTQFKLNGKKLTKYTKQRGVSSVQLGDEKYIDVGGMHSNLNSSAGRGKMIFVNS